MTATSTNPMRQSLHRTRLQSPLERPSNPQQREMALIGLTQRFRQLLITVDAQRADDIIQAHIAAAMPLQVGAREQAELTGQRIQEALAHIAMLTAREVALKTGSVAVRPETLTAQWLRRKQIFALELAGYGTRFPAFQFQPSGQPWPALKPALPGLLKAYSSLHLLLWFDTAHPALGNQKPSDVLHDPQALMLAFKASAAPIDIY